MLVGLICAHNLCCACVPRFTRMPTTICQKLISLKYRRFSELLEVTEQIALFWLVGHFDDLSNNFTHKRSSFGCSCSSFYWLNLLIKHQLFVCWSIWWVLDLVTYLLPMERNKKKIISKTAFMNVRKISVICSAALNYQGLSFVWNYKQAMEATAICMNPKCEVTCLILVCVCVWRSLDISLYGFILWLVSLLSLEEQSLDKMQAATQRI